MRKRVTKTGSGKDDGDHRTTDTETKTQMNKVARPSVETYRPN